MHTAICKAGQELDAVDLVLVFYHLYLLNLASALRICRDITSLRCLWNAEATGSYSQRCESVMLRWQRVAQISLNSALLLQPCGWVFRSHFSGQRFSAKSLQCKPCWTHHRACHAFRHWESRAKLLHGKTLKASVTSRIITSSAISRITAHSLVHLGWRNVHIYKADQFWKVLVPASKRNLSE